MDKQKKPRNWLIPAIFAVLLFVGGIAQNLLANTIGIVPPRYVPYIYIFALIALIAAVVVAVRESRQPPAVVDAPRVVEQFQDGRSRYLSRIARETQFLPLPATDISSADAATGEEKRLRLTDVYIKLDTRDSVAIEGEKAGLLDRLKRNEPELRAETRPLPALEALTRSPQMVLLGDPGGGKSTFTNHIAFCLASDQLDPRAGWLNKLETWPPAWNNLLPVPVVLRDLAAWLERAQPRQRKAGLLAEYLRYWLEQRQQADFADALLQLLAAGKAILLIDGLDEVRPVDAISQPVAAMLNDLPQTYPGPILVTCRVLSYQDKRWQLAETWPTFELARLDADKIDGFIVAWYNQLALMGVEKQAGRQTADLQRAVRRRDLWRMARNPLLLTVMAILHSKNKELPEEAASVYEEAVSLLLWRWETAKHPIDGDKATDWRDLLQQAGLRDGDVLEMLRELAFAAHAQMSASGAARSPDDEEEEPTADISEDALRAALRSLIPDEDWGWDWADALLKVIKFRAGLLVESRPGLYRFPHRTFQEFLAGSHLSVKGDFTDRAVKLAEQGAYWWDVILLGVGRLVHVGGEKDKPLALLYKLCPDAEPDHADDVAWRKTWLAGRCLLEIGPARARRDELGAEVCARLQARLTTLVAAGLLEPRERAEAGGVLSELGDPRDLDEMAPVPAGEFLMGSTDDDQGAYDDEKPQHPVYVPAFRIGKYPITNGQYAEFVTAANHEPPQHWRGPQPPPELRNHPVVNVRWYDAVAYCEWLSQKQGREYRLPTEAEWEKAARGPSTGSGFGPSTGSGFGPSTGSGSARIYPWVGDFDARKCNMADTGVGGTSPVGMFPAGASPYGCLDMSGNVWEWTLSKFVPYPYADDARNQVDRSGDWRVMRGGSYYDNYRHVRCASRSYYHPVAFFGDYWGLRVVAPGL